MPAGTPRDEVIEHYRRALGADALFACEGFDCGRSNAWASQVYGQAVLYGPDRNQFYIAADRDGRLVSAYVIERGNRRIYAHIEVLQPEEAVSATGNAKLTERLAGDGFAGIGGVRPRRDGTIPPKGWRYWGISRPSSGYSNGRRCTWSATCTGRNPAKSCWSARGPAPGPWQRNCGAACPRTAARS